MAIYYFVSILYNLQRCNIGKDSIMEKLIILCGPSGTGKTTIQNYLLEQYNIPKVLTHTTRAKRKGEKDGVDYYFETSESFAKNHYFESVNYDGKQYGSSREGLEKAWEKNPIVSLVVDTLGAIQYVKRLGKKVTVWHIEVTDPQILKQRLIKRGDAPKLVEQRMSSTESQRDFEIPAEIQNNTVVVRNDDWEQTKKIIDQLIKKI